MTLTDSGPLAALYLPSDDYHQACVEAVRKLSTPMVTTLACFTEAMHFVNNQRGWSGQQKLWQLVVDGRLEVRSFTPDDLDRMRELMDKYSDTPMDLADASLVALAETLNESLVFTTDSHFKSYKRLGRWAFKAVPE